MKRVSFALLFAAASLLLLSGDIAVETVVAGRASVPPGAIDPASLQYLGAFRLPAAGAEGRPFTFEYGGNAMTFNPDGDPRGPSDGFPGSLFITGHDRLPYGELSDGSRVAELSIPVPTISRSVASLRRAAYLRPLSDPLAGRFTEMEEIVRIGMLYFNRPETGPLVHVAWGQHIEPDPTAATHGWFGADLSAASFRGPWFLDGVSWYSVNDYMFEIPAAWANQYAGGRVIATGRFKDGGWSGMGPALVAYRPWDANGRPAAAGARLEAVPLLLYASSVETDDIERCLSGYQHPDEWSGGAWLTASNGRSAVLFAGAKSNGTRYWYGYISPNGPNEPCLDADVTDFVTCRNADGTPSQAVEIPGHNDYRGWWTTRWDATFLLYDTADLARVAAGQMRPWEPQPYASIDIDDRLFLNPSRVETAMLGEGDQRRYRIGDVAYDRRSGIVYVLELFADETAPVVHAWRAR